MADRNEHVTSLYAFFPSPMYLVISRSNAVIFFTRSLIALICQKSYYSVYNETNKHLFITKQQENKKLFFVLFSSNFKKEVTCLIFNIHFTS